MSSAAPDRITRADIESKLRQVRDQVEQTTDTAKSGATMVVAGVAAVVVIGVAFFLGKRRGRRKTTTVEIRRV